MKRTVSILFVMLGGGIALISAAGIRGNNAGFVRPSDDVRAISTTGSLASVPEVSSSSRRAAIENIARHQHRSIERIELDVANAIVEGRRDAKAILGNYDPGIHIVHGTEESRIDRDVVKLVPDGSFADVAKIASDSVLRRPEMLSEDKTLYIEPTSVVGTRLSDAKMVGYQVSGGYLNGNDYARTDVLRRLEATPSGRSGWTGLTRVYAGHAALDNVIFDELDITAGQQIVLIPDNTLNSRVGPYRATLARFKSEDGSTMSDLNWFDSDGRSYSLKIRQIDDRSVGQLMLLAEKLVHQAR